MRSRRNRVRELETSARNFSVPKRTLTESTLEYLIALDCPRALTVFLLFQHEEHQQLVDLDCSPDDYRTGYDFRDAYIATCLFTKADFLKLEVDRKAEAHRKFLKFEEQCKSTNDRFADLSLDPTFTGPNVSLLNVMVRKIEDLLGEYDVDEFFSNGNWGPGVTTITKGCHVSDINKFHQEDGITLRLYSLVRDLFPVAYPLWWMRLTGESREEPFTRVFGNDIVTVPKNAKTDRVIAIEPGINLWFQKAMGSMIRRRLLREGIDLNHQSRNQRLARLASKTGHLATIDFSSASDSISWAVVREVMPPRWFLLLDTCRSPLGKLGDTIIQWEKFSSMGNGFTFELESLIFYAAAFAVVSDAGGDTRSISVYGDDVILPANCTEVFSSFCAFLGFTVNQSKSFSAGPFRESCGVHFYDGIDCKPIYLKGKLTDVTTIYKLANSVRHLAHRCSSAGNCDRRFRPVWDYLVARTPKPLRLIVSASLGDCGFVGNFDEATPSVPRNGIEGYLTEGLVARGQTAESEEPAVLLARLRAMSISAVDETDSWNLPKQTPDRLVRGSISKKNSYTLRGVTSLKCVRMLVPQWYNFGSWADESH